MNYLKVDGCNFYDFNQFQNCTVLFFIFLYSMTLYLLYILNNLLSSRIEIFFYFQNSSKFSTLREMAAARKAVSIWFFLHLTCNIYSEKYMHHVGNILV